MRLVPPFVCIWLVGCATTEPNLSAKLSESPASDIVVERLWTRDGISKIRVVNASDNTVRYVHWAGQGPEPVAYCLREDTSEWLCSEHVYVEGDESSGYSEWSHDTVMGPRSRLTFRARAKKGTPVGIKVYPAGSSRAELVLAK